MNYQIKEGVTVDIENAKHFPVFTPGIANKELVEDYGLKSAMSYIDANPDYTDHLTIEHLCKTHPKEMVMEMVDFIKLKMPEATETQIVMTILSI